MQTAKKLGDIDKNRRCSGPRLHHRLAWDITWDEREDVPATLVDTKVAGCLLEPRPLEMAQIGRD
jgi:hypothetical protein